MLMDPTPANSMQVSNKQSDWLKNIKQPIRELKTSVAYIDVQNYLYRIVPRAYLFNASMQQGIPSKAAEDQRRCTEALTKCSSH